MFFFKDIFTSVGNSCQVRHEQCLPRHDKYSKGAKQPIGFSNITILLHFQRIRHVLKSLSLLQLADWNGNISARFIFRISKRLGRHALCPCYTLKLFFVFRAEPQQNLLVLPYVSPSFPLTSCSCLRRPSASTLGKNGRDLLLCSSTRLYQFLQLLFSTALFNTLQAFEAPPLHCCFNIWRSSSLH